MSGQSIARPLAVFLICLLCAPGVFAEAYSIPVSTRLIEGQLTFADGEWVQFAVLEGSMLTLRDSEEEYFLGLTPIVMSSDDLEVRFNVFEIEERGPGQTMLREIGATKAAKSAGAGWVDIAHAEIEVHRIRESGLSESDLRALQAKLMVPSKLREKPTDVGDRIPNGGHEKDSCCVTCGSITACGCAVQMSCGSCCVGSCCTPAGEEESPQVENK